MSEGAAAGFAPSGARMGFSAEILLSRLRQLPVPRRYLVAFSGGCDSTVLLHAMASLGGRLRVPLAAVHVDHGLSPSSGAWAVRCETFCRELGVSLDVHRLTLRVEVGESLEAAAREQRYRSIGEAMRTGDAVVTAHQRDDQAETFLLLLLRGSGPRGLAGMPEVRPFGPGLMLRPLLQFGRRELETYARSAGLRWIEDASNRDERFDRNFLRRRIVPALSQRWPAAVPLIARAASFCSEAEDAARTLAATDVEAAMRGRVLLVSPLVGLSEPRRRAALRHWLERCGLPPPDHRRLAEILRQLETARPDALPLVTWRGGEVRRWRGGLYAAKPLPPAPTGVVLPWGRGRELQLPARLGMLAIAGPAVPDGLEVRFRQGGETCRLRGMARPLKKMMQDCAVPPWLRSRLPLVYLRDTLVAVGSLVFCDGWPSNFGLTWTRGSGWPAYDGQLPLDPRGANRPNVGGSCEAAEDPLY